MAEEIYDAITKEGSDDTYELDSLDGSSTNRSNITPNHFKAWAVLNALCPRFSYGMMRGTLNALTAKSGLAESSDDLSENQLLKVFKGYFEVVRRGVKSSCSDGNFSGYSLCYDKLKNLASLIETTLDKKAQSFNFSTLNEEHEKNIALIEKQSQNSRLNFNYQMQRMPEVTESKKAKLLNDISEIEKRESQLVQSELEKIEKRKERGDIERFRIRYDANSSITTRFGVWP